MIPSAQILDSAAAYFRQGGPVMAPLLLVSLIAWALVVERWIFYRDITRDDLSPALALAAFKNCRVPPEQSRGLCARLAREMLRLRSGDRVADQKHLDRLVLTLRAPLQRSVAMVATLAAAAPLMGLFGTVTGMIDTFDAITCFGAGNARALAAGISEALISTQSGLLVGIPALFAAGFMRQRIRRLEGRLQETAIAIRRHLSQMERNP